LAGIWVIDRIKHEFDPSRDAEAAKKRIVAWELPGIPGKKSIGTAVTGEERIAAEPRAG
jgi:hypothetical protein